jgi:hypothetical protein
MFFGIVKEHPYQDAIEYRDSWHYFDEILYISVDSNNNFRVFIQTGEKKSKRRQCCEQRHHLRFISLLFNFP